MSGFLVRCKSYEKAKKKLTIIEAPNILTIALKRFQVCCKNGLTLYLVSVPYLIVCLPCTNLQSGKFGKLSKSIQFPEILNMVPFMSSTSDTSPIYRLYGVVVHLDIMNASFSGHYICYVKNIQNKWFEVDDSSVCFLLTLFKPVFFLRHVIRISCPIYELCNHILEPFFTYFKHKAG